VDTIQILVTAGVGMVSTAIAAWVASNLTRRQERKKQEIEVASKLAALNSTDDAVTRMIATQFAQGCLVIERQGNLERDRVFIPIGCRLSLGRGKENHIIIDDLLVSKQHAAFRAVGPVVFIEPLSPTNGLSVNGAFIQKPTKLSDGDVITVPGSSFSITFVALTTL
jgi:hypothetical protein